MKNDLYKQILENTSPETETKVEIMTRQMLQTRWSEPSKPNNDSSYDHCFIQTPLGDIWVEWKSWKINDTFNITNKTANEWVGYGDDLEDAKRQTEQYLRNKYEELKTFLEL